MFTSSFCCFCKTIFINLSFKYMMRTYYPILCIIVAFASVVSSSVMAQDYDAVLVKDMVNNARTESRYCGGNSCPSVGALTSDTRLDAIAF